MMNFNIQRHADSGYLKDNLAGFVPTYTKGDLQKLLIARKQLYTILAVIQDRADEHTANIFYDALDKIEYAYTFLDYYLNQNTEDSQ